LPPRPTGLLQLGLKRSDFLPMPLDVGVPVVVKPVKADCQRLDLIRQVRTSLPFVVDIRVCPGQFGRIPRFQPRQLSRVLFG